MRLILACLFASMSFAALAQEAGGTVVPLPKPRPAELSSEPAVKLPRHRPATTPEKPAETPGKPAETPPKADPIGPPLPPGEHVAEPAEPTAPPRIYQTACPAVLLGKRCS